MPLHSIGNALLVVGNRFLQVCCSACGLGKKICSPQQDECGNAVLQCVDSEEGSPACPAACAEPPPPCECGPTKECDTCYECVERQCERIEGCCADGTPCPACSKCENGSCVPCGECEQCSGGECVPCGPCQKCVDGTCGPCEADEECVNGVCVKKKYWCCWDSCADKLANTNNTTCKAETTPGVSPCGTGQAGPGTGQGTCDLTKSGPYNSLKGTQPNGTGGCEANCHRYACTPDACGINRCVKNANGQYATKAECEAACGDPCDAPCTFAGGNTPGVYSIDGCEREICVAYSSLESRPIRVQILGPNMIDGCPEPGSRVIKADSNWRGQECCDCPNSRPAGQLQGGAKGQVTWNKPRGATWFEVYVFFPCANGSTYELDIRCDSACSVSDPCNCPCDPADPLDCSVDNEDCRCCPDPECPVGGVATHRCRSWDGSECREIAVDLCGMPDCPFCPRPIYDESQDLQNPPLIGWRRNAVCSPGLPDFFSALCWAAANDPGCAGCNCDACPAGQCGPGPTQCDWGADVCADGLWYAIGCCP